MTWILQLCEPGRGFQDRITDFDFVSGIACQYGDSLGMGLFALVVYTAIAGSIYIRTGSVILPLGLLLLGGGAFVGQMAGVAAPFVVAMLLIVPAGIVAYLYWKFT